MEVTTYSLAERFIGIQELPGPGSNPFVLAMLQLDNSWPIDDDIPWCSAFVNYICWLLRLPRSKSLAARSWLMVGVEVKLEDAKQGDVVVLRRPNGPGPEILQAPGHVAFFSAYLRGNGWDNLTLLGGNQNDMVRVGRFPVLDVLSVRRLG